MMKVVQAMTFTSTLNININKYTEHIQALANELYWAARTESNHTLIGPHYVPYYKYLAFFW